MIRRLFLRWFAVPDPRAANAALYHAARATSDTRGQAKAANANKAIVHATFRRGP